MKSTACKINVPTILTGFNYTEFGIIKNASGSNNFVLSAKQKRRR
jgi:hypothetical protein